MNLNTCNFIKRIEQVLAELDISAIEEYVIIIIIINIYIIVYKKTLVNMLEYTTTYFPIRNYDWPFTC